MKKFILYILLFAIPIVVLAIIVELNLRKIPNNYSYKSNYLDKNSRNLQVLFLGSSHAFYDINPEYISSSSFNAGYTSQSLDYDFEILNKYRGQWDNLHFIVLPIDYFSLFSRLEDGIEAWRVKNYNIYYGIQKSFKIEDNAEIFSNRFNDNFTRLYKFKRENKTDFNCSKLGFGTDYDSNNIQNIVETGKAAALRHKAKDDQWFEKNVDILNKIVAFAKERNIKIILYTSPAYKTYIENLDTLQLNRTFQEIQKIVSSNSNLKHYNFLNDKSFDATDFFDGDHLNDIGAKKMTFKMDSLIKKAD